MNEETPVVFVVDDDASVRKSLGRLLQTVGYEVEAFANAGDFLARDPVHTAGPRCAVLDVELPGASGMELHRELSGHADPLPVVFISGHGDIPMSVQAMKDGAVDFLPKPFDADDLVAAVDRALERDEAARSRRQEADEVHALLATLTPREFEVLRWVISGLLNKQIARRLDITEKTVKVHRGRVMQKMRVTSLAELVRLAERDGIRPPEGAD